ncbi:MAG: replication initiator protein [Microviridae sp.]|nr:MAG: replication initiator protein [Microviridae sp.]
MVLMACFHPLRARITYDDFLGKKVVHILKSLDPDWNSPDVTPIPCGKCIGCKLDKSREWANRCLLELEYHSSAYFVTLTYNERYVPVSTYPGTDGVEFQSYSLCRRDVQLFLKRLRKAKEPAVIRFFGAGEYGETTMRPHYHLILFGLELDDLIPYEKSERGDWYYKSAFLERIWSKRMVNNRLGDVSGAYEPLGEVIVAEVSWETCAYTARYCTKSLNGFDKSVYTKFGMEPPSLYMSRNPGIGNQYFKDHPELYDYQYISVSTSTGGKKFPIPKYFDRLQQEAEEGSLDALKERRQAFARASSQLKASSTTLDEFEYGDIEEQIKKRSVKALTRKV